MHDKIRRELATKFRSLLMETTLLSDLEFEVEQAARRLDNADLYNGEPIKPLTVEQAVFQLIVANRALEDQLPWLSDFWREALTPEEFITTILPVSNTLD